MFPDIKTATLQLRTIIKYESSDSNMHTLRSGDFITSPHSFHFPLRIASLTGLSISGELDTRQKIRNDSPARRLAQKIGFRDQSRKPYSFSNIHYRLSSAHIRTYRVFSGKPACYEFLLVIGGGQSGLFACFYGGMRKATIKLIDSMPSVGWATISFTSGEIYI